MNLLLRQFCFVELVALPPNVCETYHHVLLGILYVLRHLSLLFPGIALKRQMSLCMCCVDLETKYDKVPMEVLE